MTRPAPAERPIVVPTGHPARRRQALVVQHLAFEDLGVFGPVLLQAGYDIRYRQAGVERVPPGDWLAAELLVVLGGPIGVGDQALYPWLAAQIASLQQRLAAGRPTLGICLGAQLMAAALGARVQAGDAAEIGWETLTLNAGVPGSPLLPLAGLPVLHWHGDRFALPEGALSLASTAATPHQAFALGRHALALQFHPEVDPARLEAWLIGHTVELRRAGVAPDALRAQAQRFGAAAAVAGAEVLRRWLAQLPVDGGIRAD
jgi:GMP synthase (glutamine-hydrolysing)